MTAIWRRTGAAARRSFAVDGFSIAKASGQGVAIGAVGADRRGRARRAIWPRPGAGLRCGAAEKRTDLLASLDDPSSARVMQSWRRARQPLPAAAGRGRQAPTRPGRRCRTLPVSRRCRVSWRSAGAASSPTTARRLGRGCAPTWTQLGSFEDAKDDCARARAGSRSATQRRQARQKAHRCVKGYSSRRNIHRYQFFAFDMRLGIHHEVLRPRVEPRHAPN